MAPSGAHRSRQAPAAPLHPVFAALKRRHLWSAAIRAAEAVRAVAPSEATGADLDVLAEAHSYSKDSRYLDAALQRWGDGPRDAAGIFRDAYLARAATADPSIAPEVSEALIGRVAAYEMPPGGDPIEAACARLALAGHLEVGSLADAEADLLAALGSVLDDEGAHRSGSPGRHAVVHGMLAAVLESGLTEHPELVRLRDQMEEILAWLVAPDGTLVEVGATSPFVVGGLWTGNAKPIRMKDLYRHPALLHAATAGSLGAAPAEASRVIPGAGFAVVKRAWPDPGEGRSRSDHLVFLAPNHSRGHQDALSVTWFSGGRWILIDAGHLPDGAGQRLPDREIGGHRSPRGVPDPGVLAEYLPSAVAHNTVAIAGSGPSPREGGFVRWAETDGIPVVDALASGEGFEHRRSVAVGADWLLVVDRVKAPARMVSGCRFLSPGGLDLMAGDGAHLLSDQGSPVAWIRHLSPESEPIDPVRGVTGVTTAGWRVGATQRPVPAWAYGWLHRGCFEAATLFAGAGPAEPGDPGPDRYSWTAGGRGVSVRIDDIGIAAIEEGVAA